MKKKKVCLLLACLSLSVMAVACNNNKKNVADTEITNEVTNPDPQDENTDKDTSDLDNSTVMSSLTPETSQTTPEGTALKEFFAESMANSDDIKAVAESITNSNILDYVCAVEDVDSDMVGFYESVPGFTKAVRFRPEINTIPFIGYIFETESPEQAETLLNNLLEKANPMWNICTEAKELVTDVSGKYVLFAMCPGLDDAAETQQDTSSVESQTGTTDEADISEPVVVTE